LIAEGERRCDGWAGKVVLPDAKHWDEV